MFRVAIMLSCLFLLPIVATAATFVIDQTGTAWVPADITIVVGDTVEWHWSSLTHTVTSGTGAADPNAGSLFDAPLDAGNPLFSYTFTVVGDVPFFCRPHEGVGMTGVIHVDDATATDDSAWGNIKALY